MHKAKYLAVTALLLGLMGVGSVAKAEHNNPGESAVELYSEAYQLDSLVRNSSLRYHVKDAVSAFARSVYQLYSCSNGGYSPENKDHSDLPGGNCLYLRQTLQSAWSPVDRYLNDTYYDYSYIYQQYSRTHEALQEWMRW